MNDPSLYILFFAGSVIVSFILGVIAGYFLCSKEK